MNFSVNHTTANLIYQTISVLEVVTCLGIDILWFHGFVYREFAGR